MSNKDKTAEGQQAQNQNEEGEEEEELVIVETDSAGRPLDQGTGEEEPDKDEIDDEDEVDDDNDEIDDRRGHVEGEQDAHGDETPEEKRERRRRENRSKRIRNRVAAQSKERLLQQQAELIHTMTARLDRLEGRTTRQDVTMLRNQLAQIESQQGDAKRTLAQLPKAGDWDGVAEVNEIQLQLREQHRNVQISMQRAAKTLQGNGREAAADDDADGEAARPPQRQAPKPDPVVRQKAQVWADQSSWIKGEGADPGEVAIVRGIDQVLAREGISARSDEYWTEFTKRVRRRLPHHFPKKAAANGGGGRNVDDNAGGNGKVAARGPKMTPASQAGGRRPLKPNEVFISPERKAAMQEGGIWDDPVKRNKQLKAYREWDKQHAEAQQ